MQSAASARHTSVLALYKEVYNIMLLEFRTKAAADGCKYLWIDTCAKTFRAMHLDFISLDVPQVRTSDIDTIRGNCLRDGYEEVLK